ncbi:MAG: SPOR domain-containing protein [Saprospiraceae bacterium]|nr:SPOR domain-containing protein [Saprospiraceae bacterium]
MTTDVNKAIQELLFEQTAVIIPSLGGFTSLPVPATVDYVQDVVTPPASKLDFNPNLVLNDGILVQHLQKNNLSTYQEAEALVENYVNSVRSTLERREIYEIPKVGRLYLDYEQKIRFMPEGTNFNADSFGLPTVDFQPLVKEKPKVVHAQPKPLVEAAAVEAAASSDNIEEPETSMLMKVLPWVVLLAAILIALALYKIFGGGPSKPIADVPQAIERLNVKPVLPEAPAKVEEDPSKSESASSTPVPNEDAPSVAQPPVAEQPKPSSPQPAPKEQVATPTPKAEEVTTERSDKYYLVVHSFGKQGNATKFASTLKGDGYATRTKKVGNLYRVGVVFKSTGEMEKERQVLANKYKAGPKTEKELEELGK